MEPDTRKKALEVIQKLVSDVEVLPIEFSVKESIRENSWTEFVGMFEGDTEFAEMAAKWRSERNWDEDDVV
jgi:hypothetical protein